MTLLIFLRADYFIVFSSGHRFSHGTEQLFENSPELCDGIAQISCGRMPLLNDGKLLCGVAVKQN